MGGRTPVCLPQHFQSSLDWCPRVWTPKGATINWKQIMSICYPGDGALNAPTHVSHTISDSLTILRGPTPVLRGCMKNAHLRSNRVKRSGSTGQRKLQGFYLLGHDQARLIDLILHTL